MADRQRLSLGHWIGIALMLGVIGFASTCVVRLVIILLTDPHHNQLAIWPPVYVRQLARRLAWCVCMGAEMHRLAEAGRSLKRRQMPRSRSSAFLSPIGMLDRGSCSSNRWRVAANITTGRALRARRPRCSTALPPRRIKAVLTLCVPATPAGTASKSGPAVASRLCRRPRLGRGHRVTLIGTCVVHSLIERLHSLIFSTHV